VKKAPKATTKRINTMGSVDIGHAPIKRQARKIENNSDDSRPDTED
jgi:hypothetical protein